ncbi:DNA-binding protein inhibitor ID-2 [Platysternon megacephalum]|uniref:DNA-binding protein inhibitor ID-2 n=1 Tax=Platysternon megacephalum TaxID=55544 RepID=A0A4D9EST9_9SAUR|nr:DNA-binding protein inhibitor ID-2 [Platysternon megacephalum]
MYRSSFLNTCFSQLNVTFTEHIFFYILNEKANNVKSSEFQNCSWPSTVIKLLQYPIAEILLQCPTRSLHITKHCTESYLKRAENPQASRFSASKRKLMS